MVAVLLHGTAGIISQYISTLFSDVAIVCSTVIASNLLLVDEIMRAGLSSLKG